MVSGRLVQRTFETEDGSRRTAIEIQVQHLGADVQFAAVKISKASGRFGVGLGRSRRASCILG